LRRGRVKSKKLVVAATIGLFILTLLLPGCNKPFFEKVDTRTWGYANKEATAVTMCGDIFCPRLPHYCYEGYIYYDTISHGADFSAYRWHCGPVQPSPLFKTFCCTARNLKRGTTYYYIAVAYNKATEDWLTGEVKSFKNGIPIVLTSATKSYGASWGILKGNLQHTGGASSCKVWFEYGTSENNLYKQTAKQTLTSTGEFTIKITGLNPCQKYFYRAVASNDVGTDCGGIYSFTPGTPIVDTKPAEDVKTHSATLVGTLTCLGGASSCKVWFEYGTSENNLYKQTAKQTLTSRI